MIATDFYEELTIAGYGGQGVILLGKLLAHAAMHEGLEVTYMPAYGAEVRGGAASCMIVMAREPIGAPVVANPNSLITLNKASCDKLAERVSSGGVIVMNSSMIDKEPERTDVTIVAVPAEQIAGELGNPRAANMVALGAYLQCRDVLPVEAVAKRLSKVLAPRYHDTIELNTEAMRQGMQFVRETYSLT